MPSSYQVPRDIGTPSLKESIRAEKARRDLAEFTKQAWPIIEPSSEYIHGWSVDAIAEHLMAVSNGQIRKLLINIPPRHAKSISVACMWPTWAWIHDPYKRWMFASYALQLSERDNRKCLDIITSPWYQRNFGDAFTLRHATQRRYENNKKGYRLAVSSSSAATGEGGDIIVVDDPHNALEAESNIMRGKVLDWWDRTMSTRVNNAKTGARVIVMQRLHQQDLSGHVLAQGGWEHLNLPAEYEPSRRTFTCIGWGDPRTAEGELLWPERFGQKEIADAKRMLGPVGYAGQYQQRPVPAGGATFKEEWIRRYTIDAQHVHLQAQGGEKHYAISDCRRIATVDIASRKTETADYTVIATWFQTPGNELLLREVIRERMDNPEQQAKIAQAYSRWRHEAIYIESVAYQLALVQQLLAQGVPCMPWMPGTGDKVSRATTASIFYAGGMIYHPTWAQWLADFEEEMLLFPKAEHDDQVDTVSMACALLFSGTGDIPTGTAGGDAPAPMPTRIIASDEDENARLQQQQDIAQSILSKLRELTS